MEIHAAERLWRKSLDYNFKYGRPIRHFYLMVTPRLLKMHGEDMPIVKESVLTMWPNVFGEE